MCPSLGSSRTLFPDQKNFKVNLDRVKCIFNAAGDDLNAAVDRSPDT